MSRTPTRRPCAELLNACAMNWFDWLIDLHNGGDPQAQGMHDLLAAPFPPSYRERIDHVRRIRSAIPADLAARLRPLLERFSDADVALAEEPFQPTGAVVQGPEGRPS